MAQTNFVYIGIGGTVVALDRATGSEMWRSDLDGDFVTIALQDAQLYAGANGELYCLDPATGNIRWHSPLKGLGRGLITIASDGHQAVAAREQQRRDDDSAAAVRRPSNEL